MNRRLTTTILIGCAFAAFGQGTVQFSNTTLTRMLASYGDPSSNPTFPVPTTPNLIDYGLFYGLGQSNSLTFLSSQLGVNSILLPGLIVNSSDSQTTMLAVPIPGSTPGETDVWIQVRAWSASYGTDWATAYADYILPLGTNAAWAQSPIANINPLGPTGGPGATIWTLPTVTNPKFLTPLVIPNIPEPSSFLLWGLGATVLARHKPKRFLSRKVGVRRKPCHSSVRQ